MLNNKHNTDYVILLFYFCAEVKQLKYTIMEINDDFYYLVTYRVNPISGKRKKVLFAYSDDAIKCMLDKQAKNLNPILTIKEIC